MTYKFFLDYGAVEPRKAHSRDAGFDLYSRETKTIPAHGSAVFDTGVHILLDNEYGDVAGVLISKSGLNVNHGITSTGLIDMGYTGSIHAKLYNNSDEDYTVAKGDKITQLVIIPICRPCLMQVEEFTVKTDRGNNGFGSSGK